MKLAVSLFNLARKYFIKSSHGHTHPVSDISSHSIKDIRIKMNNIFLAPTIKRYFSLFWKNNEDISLLRILQYEELKILKLKSPLLDFGGGEKAKYKKTILDRFHQLDYESANIDPNISPTYIIKEDGSIPVKDCTYYNVLSLNTFEHIYNNESALKEAYRILKFSGILVIMVPYLVRVHGHPDDFNRHTSSWWLKKLSEIGFQEITIHNHVWGPFSTGAFVSGLPGPFKRIRLHFSLLMDLVFYIKNRAAKSKQESYYKSPLGYYIRALK